MKVERRDVPRREVVESYVRYDCAKKERPLPDLSRWEWSSADALDAELKTARCKSGILAGYLTWDFAALSMDDLRCCAVESRIFPGPARVLSVAEREGHLRGWRPDRPTTWFDSICRGESLRHAEALILRPAVRSEHPATWYLEDGSGRGATLLANAAAFVAQAVVAFAYTSREPDAASTFMRTRFGELLGNRAG